MFDWYKPVPNLDCPNCADLLEGWQGKDGENLLFTWQQNEIAPIGHFVDEPVHWSVLEASRLPEFFDIYTRCEACDTEVTAYCFCVDGVWHFTFIPKPGVVYPSGWDFPLFRLGIPVEEIARRLRKNLDVYDEEGLGTFRGFWMTLNFGANIELFQSDHLMKHGHKGPVVQVDAFDAIKFGHEKLYWGSLHALGLSERHIDMNVDDVDAWMAEARKFFHVSD